MKPAATATFSGFVFQLLVLCPGVAHSYETYGHLDANKSNAILVLPFFSGTGHAAGKFADSDQAPGY
jgi:homoserine O-acetyltransferase/O-succinyltransferase